MSRPRVRFVLPALLLVVLVPLSWLIAGVPERASAVLEMGDAPGAVAVSVDDRILAVASSDSPSVISWLDTADFGGGPFTVDLSADSVGTMTSAEVVRLRLRPRAKTFFCMGLPFELSTFSLKRLITGTNVCVLPALV